MSELGWVDFSSSDRERVSQLLTMLTEAGALDELGIGQVRDAFSEAMFAGFSTIQTRASYLISVPRIVQDYFGLGDKERQRTSLANYLRESENQLAAHLAGKHSQQDEKELGIIGRTVVDKGGAARRPSSIYWNSLRKLGLVRTSKNLTEFCREAQAAQARPPAECQHEEGGDAPDVGRLRKTVLVGPDYAPGWMARASIHLTPAEAAFLHGQIGAAAAVADCVPTQLIRHGLLRLALEPQFETFAQLSAWMKQAGDVSPACKNALALAQEFSDVMEGAQIRLDALVVQNLGDAKLLASCEQSYASWRERVKPREGAPAAWMNFLPANVRLHAGSRAFIEQWHAHLVNGAPLSELDALVRRQAIGNKKQRSILKRSGGAKAYQPGDHALQYRWAQVRRILADIQASLPC